MRKETLATSDFIKTQSAVFECGVEREQVRDQRELPVCYTNVKIAAKTIKFTKPRKVCAK